MKPCRWFPQATLTCIGLLFLLIPCANADSLQSQTTCDWSNPISTTGPGPIVNPVNCSGPSQYLGTTGTLSESDLASYAALGSKFTLTSPSGNSVSGAGAEIEDYSVQVISITGVSNGTKVNLNFQAQFSGTYSYGIQASPSDSVYLHINPAIYAYNLNGGLIGGGEKQFIPVAACGAGTPQTCDQGPIISTGGSGSLTQQLSSGVIPVTAGTPIAVQFLFDITGGVGEGVLSADFLDPFSIIDVQALDPASGNPIAGISVVSDAGPVFPVNVNNLSAAPEPGVAFLTAPCLLLLICRYIWSRRTETNRETVPISTCVRTQSPPPPQPG